ncbi:putative carboxylesterase 5A [Apostichopus japonicus]|uniref:Putative carboxylesterase 5A n=1 Tax=Stichopus japonicus TaxID=307972 RepID=A0A2G8JIW3_STIJA|nr:putative carboxylesterase 5A [Apostichopus japonicus]
MQLTLAHLVEPLYNIKNINGRVIAPRDPLRWIRGSPIVRNRKRRTLKCWGKGGDPTTVTVQQGQIVGETVDFNEDGISTQVDIFKGIPFAEPPLRFAAPKPKEPGSVTGMRPILDPLVIRFQRTVGNHGYSLMLMRIAYT